MDKPTRWWDWAFRLQAISQNGLTFAGDARERAPYLELGRLAAQMIAAGTGRDVGEVSDLVFGGAGYATPAVAVQSAVFRGERLLLLRRADESLWKLPGGWAATERSPSENALLQVQEACGLTVSVTRLLAFTEAEPGDIGEGQVLRRPAYRLLFECDAPADEAPLSPKPGFEVALFTLDEVELMAPGQTNVGQLVQIFAYRRHPTWPPNLDR